MAESLDPTASWPRHLQASWRDCIERGEVEGQHPPHSMIEAYLLVADVRLKRLGGIPWGDGRHDLVDDEELMLVGRTPPRAKCARCGAGGLEHFYTAREGGDTLCRGCFQHSVGRGIAREADTAPTDGLGLPALQPVKKFPSYSPHVGH